MACFISKQAHRRVFRSNSSQVQVKWLDIISLLLGILIMVTTFSSPSSLFLLATIFKIQLSRNLAPSVDLWAELLHLGPHLLGPELGVRAKDPDLAQRPLLHQGLHNPEHQLEHAARVDHVGRLQGLWVVF